ncbi:MAG: hypothetical protein EOO77_35245 [Oxalobacteraceae bacterium]|nr:MAG: hypothetical protein EOO77_35245 [Oxalobacteraceae bacterium]
MWQRLQVWRVQSRQQRLRAAASDDFVLAVDDLPSPEALRTYYLCTSPELGDHRQALRGLGVIRMKIFRKTLFAGLALKLEDKIFCGAMRRFLSALLGPHACTKDARRDCLRLIALKHPDKWMINELPGPRTTTAMKDLYDILHIVEDLLNDQNYLIRHLFSVPSRTEIEPAPSPRPALGGGTLPSMLGW